MQADVVEDAPYGRLGQWNQITGQMLFQLVQLGEYRFFVEGGGLDLHKGVDLSLQLLRFVLRLALDNTHEPWGSGDIIRGGEANPPVFQCFRTLGRGSRREDADKLSFFLLSRELGQ